MVSGGAFVALAGEREHYKGVGSVARKGSSGGVRGVYWAGCAHVGNVAREADFVGLCVLHGQGRYLTLFANHERVAIDVVESQN